MVTIMLSNCIRIVYKFTNNLLTHLTIFHANAHSLIHIFLFSKGHSRRDFIITILIYNTFFTPLGKLVTN
jgi:hypothetical protein